MDRKLQDLLDKLHKHLDEEIPRMSREERLATARKLQEMIELLQEMSAESGLRTMKLQIELAKLKACIKPPS